MKFLIAAIFLLFLFYAIGLRINFTASAPFGIYMLVSGTPAKGEMASFCLDSWAGEWLALAEERSYLGPGFCPRGLRPLLKTVSGLQGEDTGRYTNLSLRHADSMGRPLPASRLQDGQIPDGFALMLGQHEGSFDSRYFGLVPAAALRRVLPVLTF